MFGKERNNALRRQNAEFNNLKAFIIALLWDTKAAGINEAEVLTGRLYLRSDGIWVVRGEFYERTLHPLKLESVLLVFLRLKEDNFRLSLQHVRANRSIIFANFMRHMREATANLQAKHKILIK